MTHEGPTRNGPSHRAGLREPATTWQLGDSGSLNLGSGDVPQRWVSSDSPAAQCPRGGTAYTYAHPFNVWYIPLMGGKWTRVSEQDLRAAVMKSRSIRQVMSMLGLPYTSGRFQTVKHSIVRWDLDTSHFTGRGSNRGPMKRGGPRRLLPAEVLVLDRPALTRSFSLRRAYLASGAEYICQKCGLPPEWQGEPMILELDHKNGNRRDNRPENLWFLCPNCHTQTPTYGHRNRRRLSPTAEAQASGV